MESYFISAFYYTINQLWSKLKLCILILLISNQTYSNIKDSLKLEIKDFIIQSSSYPNKIQLELIERESGELSNISAKVPFNINGLRYILTIKNSRTILPIVLEHSTFIYLKPQNTSSYFGSLYYVIKKEKIIIPIKITNWLFLVLLLLIVGIWSLFRNFFIIAIILLILVVAFGVTKEVNLFTSFSIVINTLKHFF